MNIVEFLDNILLPDEPKSIVLDLINKNKDAYDKYVLGLCDKAIAEKTYQSLTEDYKDDETGYNVLSVYLLAALEAYKNYQKLGISDTIYYDTMKVFTRFMNEVSIRYNKFFFDRAFWTYRQTGMTLYRIGTLEYEFIEEEGNKKISIHIPSDSVLTKENIDNSLDQLDLFIKQFYPSYCNVDIRCGSWLMSERLKEHLGADSRILLFQSYFDIIEFDPMNMDIYEWVFKSTKETQFIDLPENTSLQRSIKKSLLNGRWIGKGTGILKKR